MEVNCFAIQSHDRFSSVNQSNIICTSGCSSSLTTRYLLSLLLRLKAAELLGKAHMMFTDKVQQEVDMDLNITVDYGDADE